ncbi:hypothetical protein ACOIWI_004531 [Vibrio vulnificus]|nr:hypothetical protein [Vibrio vulnificus]
MNLNELVNEPEILDKKIYRIFSFERFCQLLVSNQLTFVRPSLWDDPFEDYFFSYKHKNEHGKITTFKEFSKNTYGQCWSLDAESDALWRIYSSDKLGVRVSTTVRKVLSCIYNNLGLDERNSLNYNLLAKSVEYKPLEKIKSEIIDSEYHPFDCFRRNKLLFTKRDVFSHESEFRFIFNDYFNRSDCDVINFSCNINSLIDEVCLDPRVDDAVYNVLKLTFSNKLSDIPINKSDLYNFNV